MAQQRELPYPGINFVVDLGTGVDDTPASGVMQVQLPDARIDVLEYRNGGDKENNPRQLQALSRYSPLILRRGLIGALDWYQWWNQLRNGDVSAKRNITLRLLNEDRSAVVMTWRFLHARPSNWHVSTLDALNAATLIETLEIVIERMEVE
jgi:phage tail-like protein